MFCLMRKEKDVLFWMQANYYVHEIVEGEINGIFDLRSQDLSIIR